MNVIYVSSKYLDFCDIGKSLPRENGGSRDSYNQSEACACMMGKPRGVYSHFSRAYCHASRQPSGKPSRRTKVIRHTPEHVLAMRPIACEEYLFVCQSLFVPLVGRAAIRMFRFHHSLSSYIRIWLA